MQGGRRGIRLSLVAMFRREMCVMTLAPLEEDEIRRFVSRVQELPPLPVALQRLIEVIYNQGDSLEDLEGIIRQDPSLSAKILRIANSSYFGSRGSVSRISRAAVMIGFQEIKSICLCTLLLELFSTGKSLDAGERERLWKHAFATGKMAGLIVQNRPWMKREDAYLLGLLHDLGRIVMAVHFGEHYSALLELARTRKVPFSCVESSYGLCHAKIGGWVGVKWAFPEVFQRVMEYHHEPFMSPSFQPEVRIIRLADILANSREHPELLREDLTLSCCGELFITEEEWQEYQGLLDGVFREVDNLWDLLK
jgi:HD-like signal output (HDOD) protein